MYGYGVEKLFELNFHKLYTLAQPQNYIFIGERRLQK